MAFARLALTNATPCLEPWVWLVQGGPLAQQISIGSARLTLSSRVTRVLLTLVRLPGFLFTLVTFRAQQILLGNTIVKLVPPASSFS